MAKGKILNIPVTYSRSVVYDRNVFVIHDTGVAWDRVVNYAPRVALQIVVSLIDNSREFIYYHDMFLVESSVP